MLYSSTEKWERCIGTEPWNACGEWHWYKYVNVQCQTFIMMAEQSLSKLKHKTVNHWQTLCSHRTLIYVQYSWKHASPHQRKANCFKFDISLQRQTTFSKAASVPTTHAVKVLPEAMQHCHTGGRIKRYIVEVKKQQQVRRSNTGTKWWSNISMGSGDMTNNISYTPGWFSNLLMWLRHESYLAFKTDLHTMCGWKNKLWRVKE